MFGIPKKSWWTLLRPRRPPPAPAPASLYTLGLSREQVEMLRALTSQPGWPVYLQVLERVFEPVARRLVNDLAPSEFQFVRGYLESLRVLSEVCNDVLTKTEEVDDLTNRRESQRIAADTARSDRFRNSRYWGGPTA